MIVDEILDRKEGCGYNPQKFYSYCFDEESIFGWSNRNISLAMDYGDNADIQKALCDYIINLGHNPEICDYINSVDWLTPEAPEYPMYTDIYRELNAE